MPRNELRTSGMMQAAVIALILGAVLHDEPASATAKLWPYLLGSYGLIAATLPWLAGGVGRGEFAFRYSVLLAVFFALPLCVAAWLLVSTPYRAIVVGCLVLLALWGLHFMVALLLRAGGRV